MSRASVEPRFRQRESYRARQGLDPSIRHVDGYTLIVCKSAIDKPPRCEIHRGEYLRGWVVLGPDNEPWGGFGPKHIREMAAAMLLERVQPGAVKRAARTSSERKRRAKRAAERKEQS